MNNQNKTEQQNSILIEATIKATLKCLSDDTNMAALKEPALLSHLVKEVKSILQNNTSLIGE